MPGDDISDVWRFINKIVKHLDWSATINRKLSRSEENDLKKVEVGNLPIIIINPFFIKKDFTLSDDMSSINDNNFISNERRRGSVVMESDCKY